MPTRLEELNTLNDQAAQERLRRQRAFRRRLDDVLSNTSGFARLRGITDEEWEEAVGDAA